MRTKLLAIALLLAALSVSMVLAQAQLEKGKEALKQGKPKEAIPFFLQILQTNPKNAEAWQGLSQAYNILGKHDSAMVTAQKAIDIDDESEESHLALANAYLALKDFKGAHQSLISGLKIKKGSFLLRLKLASVLMLMDSVDRAVVVYTQAKDMNPNSSEVFQGLGDAYQKMGVLAYAIPQYEKAFEFDPKNELLAEKLGWAYLKERKGTEAVRVFKKVLDLNPDNQEINFKISKILFQNSMYPQTLPYLKSYLDRWPKDSKVEEVWMMFMESNYRTKNYSEAAKAAERVLQTDPKNVRALKMAIAFNSNAKKYEKVIEWSLQLKKVDKFTIDDYKRLIEAYSETKKQAEMLAEIEEAVKFDPTQKDFYSQLGYIYMKSEQWEKAAEMFEKRFRGDTSKSAAIAMQNYASCNLQLKRWDLARKALIELITIDNNNERVYLSLAQTYLSFQTKEKVDSLKQASEAYQKFLQLTKGSSTKYEKKTYLNAYNTIGISYLSDKRYEPAIDNFQKALKLDGNNAQIWYFLGGAYQGLGKKDDARQAYEKASKLDPNNADYKKAIELLDLFR
ncbi:MAG: tetratricopeptide repeat protein [bacterium]